MNRLPFFPVLAVLCLLISSHLNAQVSIGVRTGLSVSSFRTPPDRVSIAQITGLEFAVPIEYRLNEWLALQSEINYVQKGVSFSRPAPVNAPVGTGLLRAESGNISLNYLQVPFLFKVTPEFDHWSISAFAGPNIGVSLGGNIDQSFGSLSEDIHLEELPLTSGLAGGDIEAIELGLTLGASFHFIPQTRRITLKRRASFLFDVRYHFGLTDIDAQRQIGAIKNRTLVVSLGYMLPLGRY